jgi:hypothetical protein
MSTPRQLVPADAQIDRRSVNISKLRYQGGECSLLFSKKVEGCRVKARLEIGDCRNKVLSCNLSGKFGCGSRSWRAQICREIAEREICLVADSADMGTVDVAARTMRRR